MSYHPVEFGGHSPQSVSNHPDGVIAIFVCHMISQDRAIKRSCNFFGGEPLIVSHHPILLGDHKHCVSGGMMLLVVEGQHSTNPGFNPPLTFISKAHSMPCSRTRNART